METLGQLVDQQIQIAIELATEKMALEIKELKEQSDYGSYGDMAWFCKKVSRSTNKAKEDILYPFKDELEGRIVRYPEKRGVKWEFNKYLMSEWLLNNFERIG